MKEVYIATNVEVSDMDEAPSEQFLQGGRAGAETSAGPLAAAKMRLHILEHCRHCRSRERLLLFLGCGTIDFGDIRKAGVDSGVQHGLEKRGA